MEDMSKHYVVTTGEYDENSYVAAFGRIAAEYFPHSPTCITQGVDGIIKATIDAEDGPIYVACYPGEESMRKALSKVTVREDMKRTMSWVSHE